MTCQITLSLGVYVLGAADTEERRRVDAHLPACRTCQAELARLAPLPVFLADVSPGMLAATAMRQSRDRRSSARVSRAIAGQWWRAGAAACVAAVAGILAGFWVATAGAAHPAPSAIMLKGSNWASHVTAAARLTATSWGTSIELRLSGLPLNVVCRLIVHSRTGATEVGGVWDAWRRGPITVPASVAWRPSGIASLEVLTPTRELLSIDAARGPG
jgi:hypothetical protein